MPPRNHELAIERAAAALTNAEAVVITAGAGMGVDSHLPDFRGDEGFWNAYPMYERLGLSFIDCANPRHFERDPTFGWGFYGHRSELYRSTTPHRGFELLRRWTERAGRQHFVVTSNVDGQFQKAGFDETAICEIHGSIHHLQCTEPCSTDNWHHGDDFDIDPETMRAGHVPTCQTCGDTARPNILMFGDFSWVSDRTALQEVAYARFLRQVAGKRLVVVEMGAGTAIPSIRLTSEKLARSHGATVIRINPREPQIESSQISIPTGALQALEAIEDTMRV